MEELMEELSRLWNLVQDRDYVSVLLACTVFGVFVGYVFHLIVSDSHRVERAVAKKAERKKIAGILEVALDQAMRQEFITGQQKQKYCEIIGKSLGVTDIVPQKDRPKIVYFGDGRMMSIPKVYASKTKNAVIKRLSAMGVDISEGLNKMRRTRDKKSKVLSALKKS